MESVGTIGSFTNAAGMISVIGLPSVERQVIQVRAVEVSYGSVVGSGTVTMRFTHDVGSALGGVEPILTDPNTWRGLIVDVDAALSHITIPILYLDPPLDIAGPQGWTANEGGPTSCIFHATIYYTTKRMGLVAWSLLRDRTSFDRRA